MKPWGGRFSKDTDKVVEEFTSSLPFDCRLSKEDITGSIAHARMLAKCGIISQDDGKEIVNGLRAIEKDMDKGKFFFDLSDEDIHMSIEKALIEKIGPVGGKLHTARSRNDQVALDMRIYLKKEIKIVCQLLRSLQETFLSVGQRNINVILPGYTHLQRAQPVLFAHHMMAHFFAIDRDFKRFKVCYENTDVLPLGSGALAGTSFPIDREYVAEELGFKRISENSMDATGDRDFLLEFLFAASLTMIHMSRISEELIMWSSHEFGFIEMDDSYATGSSIMPQKKNPDVAELVRGKTGRVFGDLTALLTTMKALPLAYSRDLQEDKEAVFDALDNLKLCLETMGGMIATMKINGDQMKKAADSGIMAATDVADYLVKKGMPFRKAHEIVGNIVKECIASNKDIPDLKLEKLKKYSSLFEGDILGMLETVKIVESKSSRGGTSSTSVKNQFEIAKKIINEQEDWLNYI